MRGNPNPTCDKECRFVFGAEYQTALYNEVVYDKNGTIISKDNNTTKGECKCITCDKKWSYTSRCGVTKFEEWQQKG